MATLDRIARVTGTIKDTVQSLSPEIYKTVLNMLYIRVVITAIIVSWGLYTTWQYNNTRDPVKQEQIKYTNFIWTGAGKTGIFMTLFWIWLLTLLAVSAYPLLLRMVPFFTVLRK